jgi:dsDNA-specific endonuclease/ATPase MutS2
LLYENFSSAEKEQGKMADNLEDLQESLDSVASKLRNLGNQQLQELVENLLKAQDQLPGMGSEEMKESSEDIAKALGSMPNKQNDERLLNLTQFFEQVAISEDPTQAKSMASAAIAEALQLAEQFFWKEAKENLLRRNQSATSAPSRYKRQVEEYFRRIAEGE